jgi:hypothetical protein
MPGCVPETLLHGGKDSSRPVTSNKVKKINLAYFLCFVDNISVLILLLLVFLLCLGVLVLGSSVRVLQHRVAHHLLVFSDTKQGKNLKIKIMRIRDPVPF